tara:strand:- start:49549 stop:49794 length:246 start_codon:yes stop_codon:yes gene_type:complete
MVMHEICNLENYVQVVVRAPNKGSLTQLVECCIEVAMVIGSSPIASTKLQGINLNWKESSTTNGEVIGSNPIFPANFKGLV